MGYCRAKPRRNIGAVEGDKILCRKKGWVRHVMPEQETDPYGRHHGQQLDRTGLVRLQNATTKIIRFVRHLVRHLVMPVRAYTRRQCDFCGRQPSRAATVVNVIKLLPTKHLPTERVLVKALHQPTIFLLPSPDAA